METWLDEVNHVYKHCFAGNNKIGDLIGLTLSDFKEYCHDHSSLLSVGLLPKSYKVTIQSMGMVRDDLLFDFLYELYQEVERCVNENLLTILDESSFEDFSNLCLSVMNQVSVLRYLEVLEGIFVDKEMGHHITKNDYDTDEDGDEYYEEEAIDQNQLNEYQSRSKY